MVSNKEGWALSLSNWPCSPWHPSTRKLAHDRATQLSAAIHLCSSPATSTKRMRSGPEKEKSSTPYAKGRHRTLSPGRHGLRAHAAPTAASRPATTMLEIRKKGYKKKSGSAFFSSSHGTTIKCLANAAHPSTLSSLLGRQPSTQPRFRRPAMRSSIPTPPAEMCLPILPAETSTWTTPGESEEQRHAGSGRRTAHHGRPGRPDWRTGEEEEIDAGG